MRLIDADELYEELSISDMDIYCKEVIMLAPTVEAKPVVHGEWDKYRISKLFKYTCNICQCDVEESTPFCPWCGADMRKKVE